MYLAIQSVQISNQLTTEDSETEEDFSVLKAKMKTIIKPNSVASLSLFLIFDIMWNSIKRRQNSTLFLAARLW